MRRFLNKLTRSAGKLFLYSTPDTSVSARSEAGAYQPADNAMASWNSFAQLVQAKFEALLSLEADPAARLRHYLQHEADRNADGRRSLVLKVWVGSTGVVDQVTVPKTMSVQYRSDAQLLFGGSQIGSIPPRDMLQPIHLRFMSGQASSVGPSEG